MSTQKRNHKLLPPPRILRHGDLPPVIEPGFRGFRPSTVLENVEEYDKFEAQIATDPLTPELVRKAQAIVLSNTQVNQMLSDKRYVSIGASIIDNKSENGEHEIASLMFVLYDYSENKVIEVFLDKDANRVTEVKESFYQPAPIIEETEKATMLAKKDSRLADKLSEDMVGNAILINNIDIEGKNYNHRILDVRFGFSDERLPRYMALVDLSSQTVLKAGPVCPDEISQEK